MTRTELRKMNLKDLASFLGKASATKSVKADKDLFARMKYTSKAIKNGEKVAKKDLLELASDCLTVMAAAETKPEELKKAPEKESSLKKKPSKGAKEEPKVESKPSKPSKNGKKSEETKPEPKKSEPKEKSTPKPKAFSFPKEFEDEDGIKYVLAEDITDIDSLRKAIEADEDLVIASHWTEQMLKDGSYSLGQLPKKAIPKRFEYDLDLNTVLYVGDISNNVLTVSMYTEALYYWSASSLKQTKNGRKGVNIMYELYRVVEN